MDPKPVQDDAAAQATLREAAGRRVPDELVEQLHEADVKFAEQKRKLEQTLGDSEYEQEARAGQAGDAVRAAEKEVERADDRARAAAPPEAKGEPGT